MSKKPLMLCILDGFGWVPNKVESNAIVAANTPNIDNLFATYPHTTIGASGMDVGLPDGQMGNSEVGHTNIGAGRIVYQELTRITKAIQDGSIRNNEAIVNGFKAAIENGKVTSVESDIVKAAVKITKNMVKKRKGEAGFITIIYGGIMYGVFSLWLQVPFPAGILLSWL